MIGMKANKPNNVYLVRTKFWAKILKIGATS